MSKIKKSKRINPTFNPNKKEWKPLNVKIGNLKIENLKIKNQPPKPLKIIKKRKNSIKHIEEEIFQEKIKWNPGNKSN